MKIIDAHMHVNFGGFEVERIIQYLDSCKIDKCWLLTWEELNAPIPSIYQHLSVEDLFASYKKYPDRIIPFYAPDPSSSTLIPDFERLIRLGLKGCGELKVTFRWKDAVIEEYLKTISRYKLPLLFHMESPRMHYVARKGSALGKVFEQLMNGAFNGITGYYITKLEQKTSLFSNHLKKHSQYFPGYLYDFDYLEKLIIRFPGVTFIGHGPHFWNNISRDLQIKYVHQKGKIKEFGIIDLFLEKYDNFFCDISGKSGYNALTRDIDQTKIFLEKHAGKILFGTDNTKYSLVQFLLSLKLDRSKLEQIFYKNANTLINS